MPLIDNVRRINSGDFKKEDQEVAERVAEIYNYFAEQVTNTLNGNVEISNLNRDLVEIQVTVGSTGLPLQTARFGAETGLTGINILRADNLTNNSVYPTGAPFITYSNSGTGTYTINHITGLPANNNFRLILELVYS